MSPELGASSILTSVDFEITLLMLVALAGYLLAYRINQSAVVGIIVGGIIIGPSLLGLVTYNEFIEDLAHLGAVVLLFTVGFEFQIKDIAKLKYLIIAAAGVLVPAVGGYFVSTAFGFDFKAGIFVGTALTATSIAITANVLREMRLLQTEVARAIIGAAVIDDVLGLLALSVSSGVVTGEISLGAILITTAKAIAFVVVGILLGRYVFAKFALRLNETEVAGKYPESIFIFAIMTAFLYATAAEFVGLSAIVGSFLAGASFAGTKLVRGHIFIEGSEHLQVIFAAIFFVSLGVIMDLRVLNANLLWFVLALLVVAVLTKIVGCGLAALLQKMNFRESLAVGVGMMPRGEVAMIVALIGLGYGLVDQGIYSAVVLMSIITTILAPVILKMVLKKQIEAKNS